MKAPSDRRRFYSWTPGNAKLYDADAISGVRRIRPATDDAVCLKASEEFKQQLTDAEQFNCEADFMLRVYTQQQL